MQLLSVRTCPHYSRAELLTMPTDACPFFQVCSGCHALLRPKRGHCCVFCSFGSVVCPPMQDTGGGNGDGAGCCAAPNGSV